MTRHTHQWPDQYLSQHRWCKARSKKEMLIWGLLLLITPLTIFMLFIPTIPFLYFFIRALLRFRNPHPIVFLTTNGILDQGRSHLRVKILREQSKQN